MSNPGIYIWDPLVRSGHWLLASVFTLNYFVLEPGDKPHQWLGYFAAAIVLLRLVHGFTRQGYSSFSSIDLSAHAFKNHLLHLKQRKIPTQSGHNPFGWLMVFALLTLFICQAISGYLLQETDYFFGSDLMQSLHALGADLLFICVCLHLAAVMLVTVLGRISLVMPMISGYRRRTK